MSIASADDKFVQFPMRRAIDNGFIFCEHCFDSSEITFSRRNVTRVRWSTVTINEGSRLSKEHHGRN
ncbi:hypothetical protein Y032_0205g1938 [Ancylostoma ceylanicum]|uniref:Uncharacterized protein n=1 Tax=Ancylostoma ceylanicum TaxID=53326 RepID=A0A016SMD8_9BILA|nr:hypothetical protein Y032_0205g1938 [Ancylostoma ceylanicum]